MDHPCQPTPRTGPEPRGGCRCPAWAQFLRRGPRPIARTVTKPRLIRDRRAIRPRQDLANDKTKTLGRFARAVRPNAQLPGFCPTLTWMKKRGYERTSAVRQGVAGG